MTFLLMAPKGAAADSYPVYEAGGTGICGRKKQANILFFLLDDVGSELDKERRNTLFSYLTKKEIQTIITTTDESLGAYGKEIKIEG